MKRDILKQFHCILYGKHLNDKKSRIRVICVEYLNNTQSLHRLMSYRPPAGSIFSMLKGACPTFPAWLRSFHQFLEESITSRTSPAMFQIIFLHMVVNNYQLIMLTFIITCKGSDCVLNIITVISIHYNFHILVIELNYKSSIERDINH